MKKGLLITNLGTPKDATLSSVRRYLSEFLKDKRVIQIPAIFRYMLLYGYIIPFRAPKSLEAYQAIWTKEGSPLLINSQALLQKLMHRLEGQYRVALGMRYGEPSIEHALSLLADCDEITVLPLYPQYSSSATGSSIEQVFTFLAQKPVIPTTIVIRDFYQHPLFIHALSLQIKPYVSQHDFILFSYHGLPESHLIDTGCKKPCMDACSMQNPRCYRAQCFHTSALLASALQLTPQRYATSFQSRLGKTPWIKPYTDDLFKALIQKGIKRLAVACPSFVADCLETLEEIGIRAKSQWIELGGEELVLIPSLNHSDEWVQTIAQIVTTNHSSKDFEQPLS